MIFFETERLRLRNVMSDDVDVMFDYRNNEICSRYQRGQTKTYEGIVDLVQRRKEDKISAENPFMIAVALKDTNEMIGEIVVMPNENTFSLGYTFSYKYHRQGYAFEALSVLIDSLHEKFADWEFISFTDPNNQASMGLLRKLGYRDLGYIPSKESQAFGKWITETTEEEFAQASRERMILETDRLVLRRWVETDAESLYEYAKDPAVGPIAGWPPHKSVAESLDVIRNVLNGSECYAICEKNSNKAIGSIELKLKGRTDMTNEDDECELGYWLGKPFWGRGYMPEAAKELLRHGFETLGMNIIWCGYYDGNNNSKRVQEKLGFTYHHTCEDVEVPLMNEIRVGHTNFISKEVWEKL